MYMNLLLLVHILCVNRENKEDKVEMKQDFKISCSFLTANS